MTNKALSIFNQLRPLTVGFDDTFRHFESMFDHQLDHIQTTAFPHYNIVKEDKNKYDIQIALAGYNKKDINVNLEDGVLSIESKKDEKKETKVDSEGEILHKGIAKRFFSKAFTVADDCEIKGAELKDGLLKVSMEKIIPESRKAKTIDVK